MLALALVPLIVTGGIREDFLRVPDRHAESLDVAPGNKVIVDEKNGYLSIETPAFQTTFAVFKGKSGARYFAYRFYPFRKDPVIRFYKSKGKALEDVTKDKFPDVTTSDVFPLGLGPMPPLCGTRADVVVPRVGTTLVFKLPERNDCTINAGDGPSDTDRVVAKEDAAQIKYRWDAKEEEFVEVSR